jgi:hypothetical protein
MISMAQYLSRLPLADRQKKATGEFPVGIHRSKITAPGRNEKISPINNERKML